jgi:hypothetical protein
MVRSPERAHSDDGGAPTRQAGDALAPGGLERLGQGHGRQHRGQAVRRNRRTGPAWADD